MKGDGKTFIDGQRFRLSALGAQRCPKFVVKVGTIIKVPNNSNSLRVKFDGNKQPTTLHRNYIELEERSVEARRPAERNPIGGAGIVLGRASMPAPAGGAGAPWPTCSTTIPQKGIR